MPSVPVAAMILLMYHGGGTEVFMRPGGTTMLSQAE